MSGDQFKMLRRSVITALGTGVLTATLSVSAMAASPAEEKAAVEKAVEALRVAMVAGDGKGLTALLTDRLSYSHSDGRVQTRAMVLDDLAGKKAFASIDLSEQTVDVVENVGVVRHVFDAVNNLPEGKTSTAHIKVLQVWIKNGGSWQLLARASTPIKK